MEQGLSRIRLKNDFKTKKKAHTRQGRKQFG